MRKGIPFPSMEWIFSGGEMAGDGVDGGGREDSVSEGDREGVLCEG